MPNRYAPPGRISIVQAIVVTPCGPHQRAICAGCVHALNTRRRGASISRDTTSESSLSRSAATASATRPLLSLQFFHIALEPIEALLPEPAIVAEPIGGVFQRAGCEAAGPHLRRPAAADQTGALQDLQVLGD